MAHPLPYSIPYITAPAPQYMLSSQPHHAHVPGPMHMLPPTQMRPEPAQRKRPKYTRSKTGCLTCRAKKIKCDEGKPNCHRCEHGRRECTWPDPAPAKKKTAVRKNSTPQDSLLGEAVSRSSGSSASRDATPNTRDIDGSVHPTSMADSTHRYSANQGYAYVESGAPTPTNRRQTDVGYGSRVEPVPPVPLSSGTSLASSYPYDFRHSPNGSISSRSSSRPSTANSLPPSHFNASAGHGTMDRDYPRWETMSSQRSEAAYSYYPTA